MQPIIDLPFLLWVHLYFKFVSTMSSFLLWVRFNFDFSLYLCIFLRCCAENRNFVIINSYSFSRCFYYWLVWTFSWLTILLIVQWNTQLLLYHHIVLLAKKITKQASVLQKRSALYFSSYRDSFSMFPCPFLIYYLIDYVKILCLILYFAQVSPITSFSPSLI